MARRMWTRTRLRIVLATSFLLLSGQALIDPGELECEEAVKHLQDCCGATAGIANVSCYAERGCGSSVPALDPNRAVCLRDASCETLRASGACANPISEGCR